MTKILVVDDERDIRELLVDELIDAGYETIEAENGAEALDKVYSDRPDVVLLDLMMPILDGIQVLEVLRFNDHTANLPVVLLTAVSAAEREQRSMNLGVNHYVTKPWEPGAIQRIIKVTLREAGLGGQIGARSHSDSSDSLDSLDPADPADSSEEAGHQLTAGDDDDDGAFDSAEEQATAGDDASEQTGDVDDAGEPTDSAQGANGQATGRDSSRDKTLSGEGGGAKKDAGEGFDVKKIFGDGAAGASAAAESNDEETEPSAFVSTGDPQLNLKLGGGVPRDGMTFIEGAASTGKSVLCQHFANAALINGYSVAYFSSQHSPTSLVSQMTSLGLNPTQYYRSNQLKITGIPIMGPSSDSTEVLSTLASQIKDMAVNFQFVIIDDIAGVTNRDQGGAVIGFLSQCKTLGNSGNSIVIAAHPDGMSEDVLIRVRSLSDGYLGLSVEKSGSRINKVLEVFKVANAETQTGDRVNFEVEPGMGIRVNALSKAKG